MSEGNIERYVPRGELSTHGVQELAAVGLSPDFPARVQELNYGLTYWDRGTFMGLRFNLRPDKDFPKVDVEARHVSPYTVKIEAGINKQARLDIMLDRHHLGMLAQLTLHQVKQFMGSYPTNETILLSATPRDTDKLYRGQRLRTVRNEPLAAISSVVELEDLGIIPNRYNVEIGFETPNAGLTLDMSYPDERRSDAPVFSLHTFHARDTATNIERVTGSLGSLLTQNWNVLRGENEQ